MNDKYLNEPDFEKAVTSWIKNSNPSERTLKKAYEAGMKWQRNQIAKNNAEIKLCENCAFRLACNDNVSDCPRWLKDEI